MIEDLRRDDFVGCVNTPFQVLDNPAETFELQLIEMQEGRGSARQEVFALLFRGPGDRFLPQAIHKLEHEVLGELDLFLVPIGKDKEGFIYEAVFNRVVQPS